LISNIIDLLFSPITSTGTVESLSGVAVVVSVGIFIIVFLTISLQLLHETAVALFGAVAVLLVTYIGGHCYPELKLLTFD